MLTPLNKKIVAPLFVLILILVASHAFAEEKYSIGKVVFIKGEAQAITPEGQARDLSLNQNIFLKETLETKKGQLKVLFEDKTLLALEENSKVLLTEYIYKKSNGNRKSVFDIIQGRIRSVVEGFSANTSTDIQFRTPTAVAGIRGTELGIIVEGMTTTIACFDGLLAVFAKNFPDEVMMIPEGQYIVITEGHLPFSKLIKFSDIKEKFSYRYLEYPLVVDQSQGSFEEKGQRQVFRGAGGSLETAGPDLPTILPGGSSETLSLGLDGTPAGAPTALPPEPPAAAPTPPPTDGPVMVPFHFPHEG